MTFVSSGRYSRGDWVLLCRHDAWLIADAQEPNERLREVWGVFDRAHSAAELLAGLARLDVADFALLQTGSDSKIAVRGHGVARWVTADGQHVRIVAPEGIENWVEIPLPDIPETVVLTNNAATHDAGWLPISSGITHVSSVQIMRRESDAVLADDDRDAPDLSEPPALARGTDAAVDAQRYDYLFEATSRQVSSADATTSAESAGLEIGVDVPAASEGSETLRGEPPVSAPSDPVETEPEAPRLIVSVPGFDGHTTSERLTAPLLPPTSLPNPPEPAPPVSEPFEIDDRTVRRITLPTAQEARGVPLVKAVPCPGGHPNPPHASTCRICREPIVASNPTTVPRPQLGLLRSSTGVTIPLDRGAIIGRNPDASWSEDSERPHVVRLASPGKEISRNHVQIKLDGWHVLLTDLGSTNGTFVTLPGQETQRLRDDPVAIVPGTLVNVADEVTFEYEASD